MMKLIRVVLFLFLGLWGSNVYAQVTSSGLTGRVVDDSSKVVEGAIVRAVHDPSGTVYGGTTQRDGSFNVLNMRVGGPYTVTITYGGTNAKTISEIYLSLGESFDLRTVRLGDELLKEVEIKSFKDPLFNNQRMGTSLIVTSEQITTLPSISRSVFDFTRLTPQASGSSFMGRDNRYNNLQLNGANFNNSFGLSSGFPGGAQPFSIDAVEQIQVAISPYDVRQTNFTGANVNIITKSGTNQFTGSVYNYWRNETFQGKYVGDYKLNDASKSVYNINGFRVGGPIIKNKLFFFINGELDRNVFPESGATWVGAGSTSNSPNISRTHVDSLIKLRNHLRNTYGYETGAYEGYAYEYRSNNSRLLARIDYNLNEKNKINFSFTSLSRINDQPVNSRSAANGSVSNSRIGANSMTFENSQYSFTNKVRSFTAEWLSTINSEISNQFLASYTNVQDKRSTNSSKFPFVDIVTDIQNTSDNYMSFGNELFSYKNDVIYNTLNIYNNLTIDKGIHHITAGASFQYLTVANSFFPYGTMYYRYASLQDFMTPNAAPVGFGYSYAYDGQDDYVRVKYGLGSLYAQDKINVNKNLSVTGGVRVELPFYFNELTPNPNLDTLSLLNPSGKLQKYDASKWPTTNLLVSPRVAFNWNPLKNKKMQVRGGTGIFNGQVPFVWFTNMPSNSGTQTNNVQIVDANALKDLTFQTDFSKYPDSIRNKYFPRASKNAVPGQLALVASDFKMPKVWRSNVAVEYKLPYGFIGSAEFIYTKDIVSVYQFNANLPTATGKVKQQDTTYTGDPYTGGDTLRPYYSKNRLYSSNPNISGAYILSNSDKGDAYSFTIGLSKSPRNGFYGSLFYTYMRANDIGPNGGSQAGSAWQNKANNSSPNETVLSPSDFFVPHRVVGGISYKFTYLNHFATTLGVFYEGSAGGRYSYTYSADMNGDGVAYDLMYIPKNASELSWTTNKVNNTTFTAQQQAEAFEKFISQDKYLNSHRGQYAQRNGAQYPYFGSFDAKLLQDIFHVYKKRTYTLQFSVDMLNVGNFLNKNWGLRQRLVTNQLLEARTTSGKVAYYKFRPVTDDAGNLVLPTSTFVPNYSFGNVWSMQLGLRLLF